MIQGWEKLDDVECQSTHHVVFNPISTDEIYKGNASIKSQLLFQTVWNQLEL